MADNIDIVVQEIGNDITVAVTYGDPTTAATIQSALGYVPADDADLAGKADAGDIINSVGDDGVVNVSDGAGGLKAIQRLEIIESEPADLAYIQRKDNVHGSCRIVFGVSGGSINIDNQGGIIYLWADDVRLLAAYDPPRDESVVPKSYVDEAQTAVAGIDIKDYTGTAGTTHTYVIQTTDVGKTLRIQANLDDVITLEVGNDIDAEKPITIMKEFEGSVVLSGTGTMVLTGDDVDTNTMTYNTGTYETFQFIKLADNLIRVI